MAREEMLDVRGGAAVTSGDGTRIGTLAGVVITAPVSHVTALVVRDIDSHRPWHPVPLADVGAVTLDRIDLTVTPRVLRGRTFPTRVVVINDVRHDLWEDPEFSEFPGMWMPPEPPLRVPVTVPRLEPGEMLIAVGVPVYADHRRVGHLRGVQIDRATGRLTGLVVDVRHHWQTHPILIPARAIDELSEAMVWLRVTWEEIQRMPSTDERREQQHELIPKEPREVGIAEFEPDSAHIEAARVLADEAEHELAARGFGDDEIRHWAEAYYREQRSGDLETFLAWIDLRERP
jgi:sporulation protein YlmC with PRC-barrel domain